MEEHTLSTCVLPQKVDLWGKAAPLAQRLSSIPIPDPSAVVALADSAMTAPMTAPWAALSGEGDVLRSYGFLSEALGAAASAKLSRLLQPPSPARSQRTNDARLGSEEGRPQVGSAAGRAIGSSSPPSHPLALQAAELMDRHRKNHPLWSHCPDAG
eukprot:GGOE01059574.1.p2 GENE.GGOE01059574.1~~GGOE01059574.1.p2  ORF type:complete len:156 (+),score=14.35 GGOE01059574.1:354-821(+)